MEIDFYENITNSVCTTFSAVGRISDNQTTMKTFSQLTLTSFTSTVYCQIRRFGNIQHTNISAAAAGNIIEISPE